ncbi:MAG: peptidoglycan bridge formation glycyltransferase FemA/FemB family protein [Candidatus Saccharibacteria bacterium]|nr:peptidoglycan bridge formation glycyltransferase FemA/FemB family protein [Candidatus Saccharibacteria bacterium]
MKKVDWAKITERFPEANLLQSPEYGEMNKSLGNKVFTEDFEGAGYALMVVRDAKRGRYLEIPCGPLVDFTDKKAVREVFEKIREIAEREKCVFVRIRPQLLDTSENLKILGNLGLRKSPMHLAAEHTVILDLTKSEEELLAEADAVRSSASEEEGNRRFEESFGGDF